MDSRNAVKTEVLASPKTYQHLTLERQPELVRPGSLEGGQSV